MNSKKRSFPFLFLTFLISQGFLVSSSYAEDPLKLSCGTFDSSREFIRTATLYCLQERDSQGCHDRAKVKFEQCKFPGNYMSLTRKAHTELILISVLSNSRELKVRTNKSKRPQVSFVSEEKDSKGKVR